MISDPNHIAYCEEPVLRVSLCSGHSVVRPRSPVDASVSRCERININHHAWDATPTRIVDSHRAESAPASHPRILFPSAPSL